MESKEKFTGKYRSESNRLRDRGYSLPVLYLIVYFGGTEHRAPKNKIKQTNQNNNMDVLAVEIYQGSI